MAIQPIWFVSNCSVLPYCMPVGGGGGGFGGEGGDGGGGDVGGPPKTTAITWR